MTRAKSKGSRDVWVRAWTQVRLLASARQPAVSAPKVCVLSSGPITLPQSNVPINLFPKDENRAINNRPKRAPRRIDLDPLPPILFQQTHASSATCTASGNPCHLTTSRLSLVCCCLAYRFCCYVRSHSCALTLSC